MYCSTICIELSRAWVEQSSTLKWSNVFKCWAGWLGLHNGILTSAINRVSVSRATLRGWGHILCHYITLGAAKTKLEWHVSESQRVWVSGVSMVRRTGQYFTAPCGKSWRNTRMLIAELTDYKYLCFSRNVLFLRNSNIVKVQYSRKNDRFEMWHLFVSVYFNVKRFNLYISLINDMELKYT